MYLTLLALYRPTGPVNLLLLTAFVILEKVNLLILRLSLRRIELDRVTAELRNAVVLFESCKILENLFLPVSAVFDYDEASRSYSNVLKG